MRVIVVGAGIIGLSVAVRLAERGTAVEVLEATRPGSGLTSTTFAWLNAGFQRMDHGYWRLRADSIERWRSDHAGATWLHPDGSLHLRTDPADAADEATWQEALRSWGEPIRIVDRDEIAALEPDVKPPGHGDWALFGRDAWLETDGAVAALLGRLDRAGGTVTVGARARSVDPAAEPARVLLVDGTTRSADAIVVTAARATPELVGGSQVPLRPATHASVPGLLVRTSPTQARLGRIVRVDDLVVRPAPGRRLLIQSGAIDAQLRLDQPESTTTAQVGELLMRAAALLSRARPTPQLEAETVTLAARALPDDGLPIVGWTGQPGRSAYVVVAHSGVVLAPALAAIAADELLDGRRDQTFTRYLPRPSKSAGPAGRLNTLRSSAARPRAAAAKRPESSLG